MTDEFVTQTTPTLLGIALRKIADLGNDIEFQNGDRRALAAERCRRIRHARDLLWHLAKAVGIQPGDLHV